MAKSKEIYIQSPWSIWREVFGVLLIISSGCTILGIVVTQHLNTPVYLLEAALTCIALTIITTYLFIKGRPTLSLHKKESLYFLCAAALFGQLAVICWLNLMLNSSIYGVDLFIEESKKTILLAIFSSIVATTLATGSYSIWKRMLPKA